MNQAYRDQFAHYLNTTPDETTKNWELEGTGVDSLSLGYNPQIDQYKTIISRNSDANFNGYQIQSSVSGKRIYPDDPIYETLNEARKKATAIETQMLEIDRTKEVTDGSYSSSEYDVLIVINEFLGENATISYDLYVKGTPRNGTSIIQNQKPVFTEAA